MSSFYSASRGNYWSENKFIELRKKGSPISILDDMLLVLIGDLKFSAAIILSKIRTNPYTFLSLIYI